MDDRCRRDRPAQFLADLLQRVAHAPDPVAGAPFGGIGGGDRGPGRVAGGQPGPPRRRRRVVKALAAVWVALVIGRYLDVMAPALYGRPINLYWDARHLGAVASMMTDSIPATWLAGRSGAPWSWGWVSRTSPRGGRWAPWCRSLTHAVGPADSRHRGRAAARCVGRAARGGVRSSNRVLAHRVAGLLAARAHPGHAARQSHSAAVVTSREATQSDLQRVRGADVYLVFVESYGAVSYDRRDVVDRIAPLSRAVRRRTCASRAARSCRPSWTRRPSAAPRGWRMSR